MLEAKLLKTKILPFRVNLLLFHCLKILLIFGNFNLQLLSVILFNSLVLKCMPYSTNSSVSSNFPLSKLIILPSPAAPSCTTLFFSIFTLRPETRWKLSSTLFKLFLQFLVMRVVSSAYCDILCSYPKIVNPSILLFSLIAMPNISAQITKM